MCTVTYLPLGGQAFVLTSSRDESPGRRTSARPERQQLGAHTVLFPRDGQAGGTWIAASEGATLCLLNGAFTAHASRPPYRHSRGLVILHYFGYPSTDAFLRDYPADGLEPFTLLVRDADGLREMRWDGAGRFTRTLDPGAPHLWASATLYEPAAIRKRQQWFAAWLAAHPAPDPAAIRHFHRTAGDGDPRNDLLMRREHVRTVSLTSVIHREGPPEMWYEAVGEGTLGVGAFGRER
jgi:YD repeat-containing protein